MGVEFRIFGEVEVLAQGQHVDIGHARQQCVLLCLLVDVNKAVSADALIDRVWADAPPHNSRNALAAYISRLRQRLPGVEIVRGPAGYALRTDALSVDLHRFRHTVGHARAAADPATAAKLFDEALSSWRGEPFPIIDTPWANGVRDALAAERLAAVLDRNDAALAAGRRLDVGDVAAAFDAHPLDERLAGQLMVAQYRSGRQADALETYRVMRERLVDELGVDPSPQLQAIHQQLLGGDAKPPVKHPVSSPSEPPVPVSPGVETVPRRATRLVGRHEDVQRITAALAEGSVVTLTGVGGVGKTRLALDVARRRQGDHPDGVWVCELAPLADGGSVGDAVAVRFRLSHGQGTADDAVVDALRDRALLLVVDNCEHVVDGAATLLDRITRECPRVTLLATSRAPLGIEAERVMPVHPLSDADAADLFAERARASRPDFDPDREPVGAVAEICRRLDGVPLAIELAAARMRAMSTLDVARRLDRLRLLSGGARGAHPRQQSVAATVDWSFRLLTRPEQDFFTRVSVFAGGFDLEAAHAVCGDEEATEDDTLDLLTGLVDKSMIVVHPGSGPTRYTVLETLRAYGRERLADDHDRVASRHANYYVDLVETAASHMRDTDEAVWVQRITPNASVTFAAPDYDNLRVAFERAVASENVELALRLVTSLPELIHLRTGYHSLPWVEQAIELSDPDHPLFPEAVGAAARAAWVDGNLAHARALAELAGGRDPAPRTSYAAYPADVLADIALTQGDASTALAHYRSELTRVSRDSEPARFVWICYNLTIGYAELGTPEAGLPAAEDAIGVAAASANPTMLAMAYNSAGRALQTRDPGRALQMLEKAAAHAGSVENNWLLGIAGMLAAAIRGSHGDPRVAARGFLDSLELWERGGPGTGAGAMQWSTLRDAARFLFRCGAHEEAVALHWAIVGVGAAPPLAGAEAARFDGGMPLSRVEAIELARTTLQRYL